MTKGESIELFTALGKLGKLKGVKFAYAISRNYSLLRTEMESLEKVSYPSKDFQEFEKKRIALVEKFSKKDKDGNPEKQGNNYIIEDGKQPELDAEFEILKKENQELWDARLKQIEEYNELLKTESTLTLHKISLSNVPVDISVEQLHSISEIIEEGVESPYVPENK
jgi:hypothetical protein